MTKFTELRLAAGLTQVEAARRLGVKQSTISSWEAKRFGPRAHMVPKIAKAYRCEIESVFEAMREPIPGRA